MTYASTNQGNIPHLEDGQFGWPVALLPYLDAASLQRALKADALAVENEWQRSKAPLRLKVFRCPTDESKAGHPVAMSYVGNAGWGKFQVDSKTEAIQELAPQSADFDWNRDGVISRDERRLTRATGVFWRPHEDHFQLTLDDVTEADGQTTTILFTENTNARNWLSRETFDIGFVVGLDRITFDPTQDGRPSLNVKSANLGPFGIRAKLRALPGRSPVPSSHHTGIINMAFADGRAEQVNVNIDPRVYLARMTWNGVQYGEDSNRQRGE